MPSQAPDLRGIYTIEKAEEDIATLRGQVAILSEAHTQIDTSVLAPVTPSAGHVAFSSSGHRKYASTDGGTYNVGRNTVYNTSNITINSTSFITIFSAPVQIGVYRIEVKAFCVMGATAHTQGIILNGPSTSNARIWSENYGLSTTGESIFGDTAGFATEMQTAAWGANFNYVVNVYGVIVFTAAGTLTFQGRAPTAADPWTVGSYSSMDVLPIT